MDEGTNHQRSAGDHTGILFWLGEWWDLMLRRPFLFFGLAVFSVETAHLPPITQVGTAFLFVLAGLLALWMADMGAGFTDAFRLAKTTFGPTFRWLATLFVVLSVTMLSIKWLVPTGAVWARLQYAPFGGALPSVSMRYFSYTVFDFVVISSASYVVLQTALLLYGIRSSVEGSLMAASSVIGTTRYVAFLALGIGIYAAWTFLATVTFGPMVFLLEFMSGLLNVSALVAVYFMARHVFGGVSQNMPVSPQTEES